MNERVRRREAELRAWVRSLRLQCERCPEDHQACLEFHHVDPETKIVTLANVPKLGWSRQRILTELAKCSLLCSNCHRKDHWERKHGNGNGAERCKP